MAERQIGHRKSCLVLSARFPVVNWRSRPVAKSAYYYHVIKATLRKQPTFRDAATDFPAKWRLWTSVEIPYWWHVTIQIWVMFVIGWGEFHPLRSAILTRHQYGIPAFVSRRYFAGKLVAATQYVDCFLRLRDVRLNLLYFYYNFFFNFTDCLLVNYP